MRLLTHGYMIANGLLRAFDWDIWSQLLSQDRIHDGTVALDYRTLDGFYSCLQGIVSGSHALLSAEHFYISREIHSRSTLQRLTLRNRKSIVSVSTFHSFEGFICCLPTLGYGIIFIDI